MAPYASLAAQPLADHATPVGASYVVLSPEWRADQRAGEPPAYSYATLGLRRADGLKLGGMAVAALAISTADRRGDAWARHPGVQDNSGLDALAKVGNLSGSSVGMGIGPALWLLGRARGDSGTAVMGLRTTESVVVGGVAVTAIKFIAGRTRPYASLDHSPTHWDLFGGRSDSAKSFASGHTTVAAAAAVSLAAEWRRQGLRGWKTVGPPMAYALATLTAGSRVRDRQHWLSDVVSGAALGMASALVVRRWHDAHPAGWIDRLFLAH
jgi:membrane-associated phospholipid phosphatase